MRPPSLPAPKPVSALFGGLYAAAYGPVFSIPILGFGNVVAVADAVLAKQVFTERPDVLLAAKELAPLRPFTARGRCSCWRNPNTCAGVGC